MAHVLIVAADPRDRAACADALQAAGHRTTDGSDAAALEGQGGWDALVLDLDLANEAAWHTLEELRAAGITAPVLVHTAAGDVSRAVAAMRAGAADVLTRPLQGETLSGALTRALAGREAEPQATVQGDRRIEEAVEAVDIREGAHAMIGRSPAIRRVFDQLRRVAATPRTTTLITGESGVGKEMVARAIHDQSARSQAPFVAINCAALADNLVEAELFGYEPGAFTGGNRNGRTGLIAAAEGGTLLLDEIGELAPHLQAKLLRVLQERCYRRIGGSQDVPMDVRIVAATNRDLVAMVEQGRFREDLYYRLNVLSIQVPPLRERPEDVPLLAERFLAEIGGSLAKGLVGFTEQALERLCASPWVGNVRELRNAIERAAIFAEGDRIGVEDLAPQESAAPHTTDSRAALALDSVKLRDVEQRLIEHVLESVGGNRSQAARELGINRATLYNKLRSYGLVG